MSEITPFKFYHATGYWPEGDELERCNCDEAGQIGHLLCGWDYDRNLPNFIPVKKRPWWKFWA